MARAWYSNDRYRRTAISGGIFLAVIILVILSSKVPFLGRLYARLEAGAVRLSTQVGSGLKRASQSETTLAAAYATCQETTRALAIEQSHLSSLEDEVEELRAVHNYSQVSGQSGILARVIARGVAEDSTNLILDRGSAEGVADGSAVVIDNGVLFGLVTEVREHSSVVRLLNSTQSKVPATILGASRSLGLVEGREGALLVMDFIPQDAQIDVNDVVVTTGLDGLIPAGLVVGLISDVVSDDSAPFKQAFVEPPFIASDWTTVYVIPVINL